MNTKENSPKVLVIQDRLTAPGGGERVAYYISKNFNCDIVTGEFDPTSTYDFNPEDVIELDGNTFSEFMKSRLKISWSDYDVAIFSGNRPQFALWKIIDIPTIRYCHSPTRIFWSLRDKYYRDLSFSGKVLRQVVAPTYRTIDAKLAKRHDLILTNSHNIRNQVERFYGLDSEVLYPPIHTNEYEYESSGDYWLSVNRLVPKKRVREQIDAFEKIDENLRIVGGIDNKFESYGKNILERVDRSENISVEGFVPDEQLQKLYSNCKGVIYIPYYEDFGIVPIESMASGKPVIAAAEGGPVETINKNTGWLIKPNKNNIIQAATSSFDRLEYKRECQSHVKQFDISEFNSNLSKYIKQLF
jgi:glycosyltransferase involved in cell wall biosynthesis